MLMLILMQCIFIHLCRACHSFLKFSSSLNVIDCASQTSLIVIMRSCLTVQLHHLMASRLKAGSPMSCHVGQPSRARYKFPEDM